MTGSLTPDQVAQYHRDGFLFPLPALSGDEARAYRKSLEDLEARFEQEAPPLPLDHFFRRNTNYVLPFAAQLSQEPAILNAVESLLGPNLMVWSCEFFIKEAGSTPYVSWHQDLTYWGLGEAENLVSAWIALSPATLQSGCMRFLAGSHKQTIQPHTDSFADDNLLSRGQELAVEVDENEASAVELQPGQFSLHHGKMFHASGANTSDDRRIGVVIRYITPDLSQVEGPKGFATLVRGRDDVGNWINIAPPQETFAPADLALHAEVLRAQETFLLDGAKQRPKAYRNAQV
ncbi:phytanoyl-CoA dioxygenase family protein [Rhodovibrionaceae bacterium A322]